MLLLRTDALPEGARWQYEVKLDGYRALAFKSSGKVHLRSRNGTDFNRRYPATVKALTAMPDETVIDGELVALDHSGRPSFNALQNSGAGPVTVVYYAFDLVVLSGNDVMAEPLARRRDLLQNRVLAGLDDSIRFCRPVSPIWSRL